MEKEDNLARTANKQEEYFFAILTELRAIKALLAARTDMNIPPTDAKPKRKVKRK